MCLAANGTFAYHLSLLVRAGYVMRNKTCGRTSFVDSRFHGAREAFALTDRDRQILEFLRSEPGSTEAALLGAFGLSHAGVCHLLCRLRAAGWARSLRVGHRLQWYRLR